MISTGPLKAYKKFLYPKFDSSFVVFLLLGHMISIKALLFSFQHHLQEVVLFRDML